MSFITPLPGRKYAESVGCRLLFGNCTGTLRWKMPISFLLRRLLLILLLALPQLYWLGFVWRLVERVRIRRWLVWLLIFSAVGAMVAVLYDAIAAKFLPPSVGAILSPPVQLWIFSSTFVFYFTRVLQVLAWCASRLVELTRRPARQEQIDTSRRNALRQTASVIGGAPFVAAFYGYAHERFRFQIERVELGIANLPAALDGLRIAQLSDIHAGDLMPLHEIGRAVSMTNDLGPHLAVITGDFLTRAGDPLEECIRELSRLKAPLGVWGCNGNHEIYADAEDEAQRLFAANGMSLLRDSATEVKWNGGRLNLIGIDYQHDLPLDRTVLPTLNGAERLVRRDMPNILLSHNPDTFHSAAAAGVELSLAGHTHGGQINLQIRHNALNPARVLTQFIAGLYHLPLRNDSAQPACLYVNRGLGMLGFPARIGVRPEITLLTLRSSPGPSKLTL